MTRRALIVTSAWSPAMIADMQRARQLAWELPSLGWAVEILVPGASYQPPSVLDPDSADFFPSEVLVHEVESAHRRLFRALGLGSIGWRALRPMAKLGDALLATRRFDLAYFSTTQFPLFLLGPRWWRRAAVPYVLDFHDPCYREERAPPVWARRSLKHEASRRLAKWVERRAVGSAAGLVAVSPDYLATLRRRHDHRNVIWKVPERTLTIPFGVLERDLGLAGERRVGAERRPAETRVVYVGAGGPVMARSFGLLCRVLARLAAIEPSRLEGVRIELSGTMLGWREGDRRHLAEIAAFHGVEAWIHEEPRRVTYRQSLEILAGSDGALLLGVDDAGYMPSKLFAYALSGKPLLAAVHREGPAHAALRSNIAGAEVLWFGSEGEIDLEVGARALVSFLTAARERRVVDRKASCAPFSAREMARRHVELFARCAIGEAHA